MPAFKFLRSRKGYLGIEEVKEFAPSKTYSAGILLEFDNAGKLVQVTSQTSRPQYVLTSDITTTANGGERGIVKDIGWGDAIWKVGFTPQINGLVAQSGGSTSVIRVLADQAYSANDFRGGRVFVKEQNKIAIITASSSAAGAGSNLDLTITSAVTPLDASINGMNNLFPAKGALLPADPVGSTIYATPLGTGVLASKLAATTFDSISQAIADKTGGFGQIMGVNLHDFRNPFLEVCFVN